MNTFAERAEIHDAFMAEIIRDLKFWGYPIFKNGRESTHSDMPLSQSNDPGSRWIRFAPDFTIMFKGRTIYIDTKHSVYIEKDPYLHYIDMFKDGIDIYIISNRNKEIRFSHIDNLEFERAEHPIWPISDDGWITPRMHPRYAEFKYRYPLTGRPYPGAGTPFRKIDFSYMSPWGPIYWALDLNQF